MRRRTDRGPAARAAPWLLLAALALLSGSAAAQESEAVATRDVSIVFRPDADERPPVFVDRLAPATVLVIEATGFTPDATGTVHQCASGALRICRNSLPVRFDQRGRAVFQYLITDAIGTEAGDADPCRLRANARCTVELIVGRTTTVVDTIFVDAAATPGRISVEPRHGVSLGQEVTIRASGFPPDTDLRVTVCAAPARLGPRCGDPAPELSLLTDDAGTAVGRMVLDVETVGADAVACGRRTVCHVVVTGADLGVTATPVRLIFASGPEPAYDATRLGVGLAAAALLGLLAAWLVRATDWSPPTESDGSAIDLAEFADLDAEAARFEEPIGAGSV